MRAGVAWSRVDPGAPIQDQEADSSDGGKCDELDPEHPVRLVRDGKEDRDEQHRDEQGKDCAARFRSSCDLAITPVRIETATNSRPVRLAAAAPATVANVPDFSNRIRPPFQPGNAPTTITSEEPTDDRLDTPRRGHHGARSRR